MLSLSINACYLFFFFGKKIKNCLVSCFEVVPLNLNFDELLPKTDGVYYVFVCIVVFFWTGS